jgi:hypothetical protein
MIVPETILIDLIAKIKESQFESGAACTQKYGLVFMICHINWTENEQ